MDRKLWTGVLVTGALMLVAARPMFSLVQPPGDHPKDHPAGDHPAGDHPANEPPAAEDDMAQWMEMNQKGVHHDHLKQFVGNFNTLTRIWSAPDTEPMESAGKSVNRMILDDRYLESHFEGEAMGAKLLGQSLTGYDAMAGQYVSVWVDTWSTGFTLAEGQCEKDGKVLTLKGEMSTGPDNKVGYREVFTILNADSYKFEWFDSSQGEEHKTMEITYTRAK